MLDDEILGALFSKHKLHESPFNSLHPICDLKGSWRKSHIKHNFLRFREQQQLSDTPLLTKGTCPKVHDVGIAETRAMETKPRRAQKRTFGTSTRKLKLSGIPGPVPLHPNKL